MLGAVRRAVESNPSGNRFLLSGSVRAELDHGVWAATGRIVRLSMFGMTVREQTARIDAPSFWDRLANGRDLPVPADAPDLRGYVELALRGGFPAAALRLNGLAHQAWMDSYVENLLTRDVPAAAGETTRRRDPVRVRRYFEAYALNSAGEAEQKTIYEAAGINRMTALDYEDLLTRLYVIDALPAWETNRLKRLTRTPKRYVVDPALVAAALRLDVAGVLADGNLLGRLLDSLRGRAVAPGGDDRREPAASASPANPVRARGGRHRRRARRRTGDRRGGQGRRGARAARRAAPGLAPRPARRALRGRGRAAYRASLVRALANESSRRRSAPSGHSRVRRLATPAPTGVTATAHAATVRSWRAFSPSWLPSRPSSGRGSTSRAPRTTRTSRRRPRRRRSRPKNAADADDGRLAGEGGAAQAAGGAVQRRRRPTPSRPS